APASGDEYLLPRRATIVVVARASTRGAFPRSRLGPWHLIEAARELHERDTFVARITGDGRHVSTDENVGLARWMHAAIRGRNDAEGGQLDQRFDRRFASMARTTSQRAITPGDRGGIAHQPSHTATGCVIFIPGTNALHDVPQASRRGRLDERDECLHL